MVSNSKNRNCTAYFKGKGAKANNKDNYRGMTLFPTISKIYEIILVNRLEKFASQKGYFSQMQFGFQKGVIGHYFRNN